jgi:hypothetical protein
MGRLDEARDVVKRLRYYPCRDAAGSGAGKARSAGACRAGHSERSPPLQSGETRRGAQFQRFRLLLARDLKRFLERGLSLLRTSPREEPEDQ